MNDATADTSAPSLAATPGRLRDTLRLLAVLQGKGSILALGILVGVLNQTSVIACAGVGTYIIGAAITGTPYEQWQPALWTLIGLVAASALLAWLEMWLSHDFAYRVLADLRNRVYDALARLAPFSSARDRSGNTTATAMSDVETLEWFYAHTLGSLVVSTLVPTAVLLALGWFLPVLSLLLAPLVLAVGLVPALLQARARQQGAALRHKVAQVHAEVIDAVQGLRELVVFGAGGTRGERLDRVGHNLIADQIAYGKRAGLERAIAGGLTALGMLIALAASASAVSRGALDPELFPVAVILAGAVFGPVAGLSANFGNLGAIASAAERVFSLIQRPSLVTDLGTHPLELAEPPAIEVADLCFHYPEVPEAALNDVSFVLQPGENLAVVGHSGAGKSTLTHLLMRFYDPNRGTIRMNGIDVREVPVESLRRQIAWVPQDLFLFNDSIEKNIALARPGASREAVIEAARLAMAHEFIEALPNGYATTVGERGVQLSGGQRQRLALARAFLLDAPVLILDEAVSSLDSENEARVQAALNQLRRNRTTLTIAHRLSTILTADRILLLDRGRVVGQGSHQELLARCPAYRDLIAGQHDGNLGDGVSGRVHQHDSTESLS